MSDEIKKEELSSEAESSPSDPEGEGTYRFLDQKIKKRPVNRRAWFLRILGILAAGIAVGLIASLVFSLMHPEIRNAEGNAASADAKITIPADEEPEETTPTPTPTLPSSTPTPSPTPTTESGADSIDPSSQEEPAESTVSGEPEDTASVSADPEAAESEEDSAEEQMGITDSLSDAPSLTLEEYKQVYRDMITVAENAEHGLVQVIGITNEMDYFDQGYENQRRVAGTIVARNDTDLFILTEYRVVDQVERIQIVFFNGVMTDATFQRSDEDTGLAVLKVSLENIPQEVREEVQAATLGNSYQVSRGEPVLALGSPTGYNDAVAYGVITSTSSKASAVDREYSLLTTDIDGSNDGSGVLINLDGQIIGIITHAFGVENGSLTALAISQAKELIQDLSNNEEEVYIGIYGQDVTQEVADRTGIPRGILVTEVVLDSPAAMAGIKEYDVIVKIGEETVETMRNYHRQIDAFEEEGAMTITAMRRGAEGFAEITFEVTPGRR